MAFVLGLWCGLMVGAFLASSQPPEERLRAAKGPNYVSIWP